MFVAADSGHGPIQLFGLFLDKVGFFNDNANSLYSRSINDPLYGIKLAGTERNLDFGLLNSIDRSPIPSFNEQETPGFSSEDMEDRWAMNSFLRLRSPIKKQGHIGITAGEKRIIKDPQSDRTDAFRFFRSDRSGSFATTG